MSTANAQPQPAVEHRTGPSLLAHKWFLFALIFLSTIGIYVTDSFPARGYTYWMAMGPVFCAFNLFTAWSRNRQSGGTMSGIAGTMLLHWAGFLAAVYVVFMLYRAGHLDAKLTGVVTLLTLALTTFLAGVHFDWRLCLIGTLLAGIVAGESLVERFLWMAVLPLAAAAALAVYWWLRRSRPDEARS